MLKAWVEYQLPTEVTYLEGNLSPLSYHEIIHLSNQPYTDKNWSQVAYSVCNSVLHSYFDEDFVPLLEKSANSYTHDSKSSTGNGDIPVKGLFYRTSFRTPGVCTSSLEFKYFSRGLFLGGMGVYTLNLEMGCTEAAQFRALTRMTQHNLSAKHPVDRLLVALVSPSTSNWMLVFIRVLVVTRLKGKTSCKVLMSLFKNPYLFLRSLMSGGKASDVESEEFKTSLQIEKKLASFRTIFCR